MGGGERRQRVRAGCLITVLALAVPAVGQAGRYRFEDGVHLGDAGMMSGWAETLARQAAERTALVHCLDDADACPHSYRGLRVVLTKARELEPDDQLRLINHFVNDRRYRKDRSVERATSFSSEPTRFRSRWSTVGEFFERGGDCEDYASTKYFLLRELGFPAENLRIVVSWDRHARGYHALLAVRRSSDSVWLLDTDNRIYKHRQTTYRFVYAVNENAVWDYDGAPAATPSDRATTTKTEAPL